MIAGLLSLALLGEPSAIAFPKLKLEWTRQIGDWDFAPSKKVAEFGSKWIFATERVGIYTCIDVRSGKTLWNAGALHRAKIDVVEPAGGEIWWAKIPVYEPGINGQCLVGVDVATGKVRYRFASEKYNYFEMSLVKQDLIVLRIYDSEKNTSRILVRDFVDGHLLGEIKGDLLVGEELRTRVEHLNHEFVGFQRLAFTLGPGVEEFPLKEFYMLYPYSYSRIAPGLLVVTYAEEDNGGAQQVDGPFDALYRWEQGKDPKFVWIRTWPNYWYHFHGFWESGQRFWVWLGTDTIFYNLQGEKAGYILGGRIVGVPSGFSQYLLCRSSSEIDTRYFWLTKDLNRSKPIMIKNGTPHLGDQGLLISAGDDIAFYSIRQSH